ncbi:MAG: VCBS repeat-containing protein [Anaerolineales bacterium]|nr:VCBS repeat-containing protein [Anaerolineales bacterium]
METQPARATAPGEITITVSGTITASGGGALEGVEIGVGSQVDWQTATTNASGYYSVVLQVTDYIWFNVHPDLSLRLEQMNIHIGNVTGDVTQDFVLRNGNLFELVYTGAGGVSLGGDIWANPQPLYNSLPANTWYALDWFDGSQSYKAVLPPDIYYVTVEYPPQGYYFTRQYFDLRGGDLSTSMALNTQPEPPYPYEPPDASKISVGALDGLGEAEISGSPGAVLPYVNVLLVNLNSAHQAHAISEEDGSFSARLYAPPGSAIMVKHGPPGYRWDAIEVGVAEMLNPFPGTILHAPVPSAAASGAQLGAELPFAAAGSVHVVSDDSIGTYNYVESAWAISGTLKPVVFDGEWTRVLTGTYMTETVPGLYLGGLNWTHPALGDLDDDGDQDLLVGERGGNVVLYRNQGDSGAPDWQFETEQFASLATGGWAYPALADVTGDGDPDLFLGSGAGLVQIYYQDGGVYPDEPDVSLAANWNAAPALDDLDGDGDLDLLVGHEGGTLYHYKNTGTLSSPAWTLQTDSYAGITAAEGIQPAFIDLDDDADRDLLLGHCGYYVWYQRSGTAGSPTWALQAGDPIGLGGLSCGVSAGVGDWNDDGDEDVAFGQHWGTLRFFRGDSGATWTEQGFDFPFDLNGESAPAMADWDDDGDLDLLVGQAFGDLHQYTNVGSASAPNWRDDGVLLTLPWTNHPHAYPTFADIDGDDDADLFIGEGGWDDPPEEQGGNIWYYENQGLADSPNWVYVTDAFLGLDVGGWSTPVFEDLDADGDLDLFVGDAAGTLTFVENTGTSTAPAWAAPVQPYADLHLGSYSAPSFFDVDQDGDLDMLVGLEHGSLAYVRNTGDVGDPDWELVSTYYPPVEVGGNAAPARGDLDGDSLEDLLLGDVDGGLNLYLYQGPGTPPDPGSGFAAGDLLSLSGQLRLYSPAIDSGVDVDAIHAAGHLNLRRLFDEDGDPLAARNYFMSTILTPTGLPIQRVEHASEALNQHFSVDDLQYLGGNAIGGSFNSTFQIPEGTLDGVYRPTITWDIQNVPTSTTWLAAYIVHTTYDSTEAPLPPLRVGTAGQPRLIWQLLMEDFTLGTRGVGALEDAGKFALASQIVTQGAPLIVPPIEEHDGSAITYRLEPFLPMISYTDRRMPTPPLIPFDLPGGELCVSVQAPDASVQDLGCEAFAQSFNRTKTTRGGWDLNSGTVQLEDVYSLMAASDRFRVSFDQYGEYTVFMTGAVNDLWGNTYTGGGEYHFLSAHPLDIDPGVLPGTPLAAGDAFNPALQVNPGVEADITLTVTHYPNSDPAQVQTFVRSGKANRYGYFHDDGAPIVLSQPGEYRVDLLAVYTDPDGKIYAGAQTWGGVVMTPSNQAQLLAHGRRGLDSLTYIPNHWFVNQRDLVIPPGSVSHSLNPYYNGDVYWSRMSDGPVGGDSLILGASVYDLIGEIETAIQERLARENPPLSPPGSASERFSKGEMPLFISTLSEKPAQYVLGQIGASISDDVDQIAYSYRSSQRPGVRVRELVAEDSESGGYWRLDTLYDDQLGIGVLGDQANDFKFQYIGAVYRDLVSSHNEYAGQGSSWIFIPDDDATGSRAMPPFAGYGGWTSEGGPLMTLKGQEIHMFILPTGVRPGAILEVGDTFHFAGHIMPTLDSMLQATVTAPGGTQYSVDGQANQVGYFYDPQDDFVVNVPGLWTVDVDIWHEGSCSGGSTSPPYPHGDVLGSDGGRYYFYVAPASAAGLAITAPSPGFLQFSNEVTPIEISGLLPGGLSQPVLDYTIRMPGYILQQGQLTPSGTSFSLTFDPLALSADFPNIDLVGRDRHVPGLADTFTINLLLRGKLGGQDIYQAASLTLQGEQVFAPETVLKSIYLPLVVR